MTEYEFDGTRAIELAAAIVASREDGVLDLFLRVHHAREMGNQHASHDRPMSQGFEPTPCPCRACGETMTRDDVLYAFVVKPRIFALAIAAAESGKPLGAICVSPTILANAGVLKGRNATVWPSQSKALVSGGATYTAQPVETDGPIITADGPASATRFGEAIASALGL